MRDDQLPRLPVLFGLEASVGVDEPLTHRPGEYLAQPRTPPVVAQPADRRAPSIIPLHTRSPSCFAWTPEQMLEDFLQAIRAGTEAPKEMVIVYTEQHADGSRSVHSWRAQLGWCEEYTYLEVAQQKCLDGQRR